jgi:hypothetical protein
MDLWNVKNKISISTLIKQGNLNYINCSEQKCPGNYFDLRRMNKYAK